MPALSSAAWVVHDVGLATMIGGSLFGKVAMHPALREVSNAEERDQVADIAWRRFSWWNLAAHGAVAATWIVGRSMLSGREAGEEARTLTIVKDACVAVSLATGVATVVLGRLLGARTKRHEGPQTVKSGAVDSDEAMKAVKIERAINTIGTINLAANLGALGTTALLAMQSSESARFAATTRKLP